MKIINLIWSVIAIQREEENKAVNFEQWIFPFIFWLLYLAESATKINAANDNWYPVCYKMDNKMIFAMKMFDLPWIVFLKTTSFNNV